MGHEHFLNSTGRHEHFLNSTGRHEHFLNSKGRHLAFLNSTCKIRTPRQGPLTGVPVKVGQTLKNHTNFCINGKILKNLLNVHKGLFYCYPKFQVQIMNLLIFDRYAVSGFPG